MLFGSEKEFDVTEARTHSPGRSILMFKSWVWRPIGYPGAPLSNNIKWCPLPTGKQTSCTATFLVMFRTNVSPSTKHQMLFRFCLERSHISKVYTKREFVLIVGQLDTVIVISHLNKIASYGGRHSSMVSSVPIILRPRVWIPSTPSTLFSICIEIVTRKGRK